MFQKTPKKRVLFVRRVTPVAVALFGVFSFALINLRATPVAHAVAVNNTVNFQARLQTAAGAIVPDGTYNVEFKLYDASTSGTALWTEDYLTSVSSGPGKGLTTVNGYLSTSLGSVTAFPSTIPWGHQLWLTMNIGGTSTSVQAPSGSHPTGWDGEMDPRLQLTAIPYAFQAGSLTQDNNDSSLTSTLSIQAPTIGNQNFVIQDQGAGGTYNLLTTNQADADYIKLQGGSPSAQTGNISITGSGSFAGGIQTAGGIALTGTGAKDYVTPAGHTVSSAISVENFNPGLGGQIVAFGLKSDADTTARVITAMDARTGAHQPSIAVLSPNESKIFGLSWDGSDDMPVLKSSTDIMAFQVGGYNAATIYSDSTNADFNIGQANSTNGLLQLSNSSSSANVIIKATGTVSSYGINLPTLVGSAGQCLAVSSVASDVESLGYKNCVSTPTLQDAYSNYTGSANIALNSTAKGIAIQDASTSVGGNLFAVQNNAGSTSYFAVTTTGTTTTGTQTVTGSSNISGSLAIGASSTTRTLQATVNNSAVGAPPVLIQQSGTGDASIEFQHGSSSFYIGQDSSNSNSFAVNSSAAASSASSISFVQSTHMADSFNTAGATSSVTLSGVTSGHLLVAGFTWTDLPGVTVTCTDTLGTTFTTYGFNASNTTQDFESCYGVALASGTDTITVHFVASVKYRNLVVLEYSGVDTSNPLDTSAVTDANPQSTTGPDNVTTHSANTSSNGDLIVGLLEDAQGDTTTVTAGTGFTKRDSGDNSELTLEDMVQTAAGPVAATVTFSTTGTYYEGAMLAFRPAAAGTVTDTFSNSIFTLSQGGAANFHNISNSSSAFRVQNAGGTSMFNVDTTNEKVTIGPSAGDTTGALLILGKKTNTGDPTETDGAMYYNAALASFRCGENGMWVSCIGGLLSVNTAASAQATTFTTHDFDKTYSIPANYCVKGRVIRVTASGVYSVNTGTTPTVSFAVKLGSTVLGTSRNITAISGGTNVGWTLTYNIVCNADLPGDGTTQVAVNGQGYAVIGGSSADMASASTSSVATGAAQILTINGNFGTSNANNKMTLETLMVEGLGP